MHIVYFHPDKPNGYGATQESRWLKRLKEQKLDVTKGRIVEQGLTLEEASDRERELQLRDGYPLDLCSYKHIRRVQPIAIKASKTPEALAKSKANTDLVKRGKAISKAKKGMKVPWLNTKEAILKRVANRDQKALNKKTSIARMGHTCTPSGKEHWSYGLFSWYKELSSGFIGTRGDMRNRYKDINLFHAVKINRPYKSGKLKGLHFIKYA